MKVKAKIKAKTKVKVSKELRECDDCGKKHNRRRFCSNKCKNHYHNVHNPRGYFDHLKHYDNTHPFSSEALGQDGDGC